MRRGNLIFSHNNRSIDYGKIALANACLIKKHMKNNHVTLITDTGTVDWLYKTFDKDFVDSKIENIKVIKRRNTSNTKRYYDTSYSKTLEYTRRRAADESSGNLPRRREPSVQAS